MWAGRAREDRPCTACGHLIRREQIEYEPEFDDGRRLRLHLGCFVIWHEETAGFSLKGTRLCTKFPVVGPDERCVDVRMTDDGDPVAVRRALIELAARLLRESEQLREMAKEALLESRRMGDEMRTTMDTSHLRLVSDRSRDAAADQSSSSAK